MNAEYPSPTAPITNPALQPHQTGVSPTVMSAAPGLPRRALDDLVDHLDKPLQVRATGIRGLLGLNPSQAEVEQAADEKLLRAVFPRPVRIAVATPKGGTGKTPTTVGLAAAFGRARGASVVAWDNNELRGTLGYRTFRSHRATVMDLLQARDYLMGADCRIADVQGFMMTKPVPHPRIFGVSDGRVRVSYRKTPILRTKPVPHPDRGLFSGDAVRVCTGVGFRSRIARQLSG